MKVLSPEPTTRGLTVNTALFMLYLGLTERGKDIRKGKNKTTRLAATLEIHLPFILIRHGRNNLNRPVRITSE